MKFEPGVLGEVFNFFKLKANGWLEMEKLSVLTLHEMVISLSIQLYMGTGKVYRDVTSPGQTGAATHACVFMLAGTEIQWKQVVAYHYIGN